MLAFCLDDLVGRKVSGWDPPFSLGPPTNKKDMAQELPILKNTAMPSLFREHLLLDFLDIQNEYWIIELPHPLWFPSFPIFPSENSMFSKEAPKK